MYSSITGDATRPLYCKFKRFSSLEPFRRNGLVAGGEYNHAADNGASRIAVTEPRDGRPERFLEVVEMASGAPEREWDGVR